MGRPLNKRYFGTTAAGGDESNEEHLNVMVKVGTNTASTEGIILSQRTETSFKVDDSADGAGNEGVCTLVDKTFDNIDDDEMILQGFVDGASAVNIRKVQNRTMIDFNNNRYTWEIVDDSTTNVLQLTAI